MWLLKLSHLSDDIIYIYIYIYICVCVCILLLKLENINVNNRKLIFLAFSYKMCLYVIY